MNWAPILKQTPDVLLWFVPKKWVVSHLPREDRELNKRFSKIHGSPWKSCPVCGEEFGEHEKADHPLILRGFLPLTVCWKCCNPEDLKAFATIYDFSNPIPDPDPSTFASHSYSTSVAVVAPRLHSPMLVNPKFSWVP